MDIGDVATWIGSIATVVAVTFAAWQVVLFRRDRAEQHRMELDGVVVTWVQKERPRAAEADGYATWLFEIAVGNPGRMPIRNVEVDLAFPLDVRRVHYDGHVDEPTRVLNLGLPVLAGGSGKTWERALRMRFDEKRSLRAITATVSFTAMDGTRRTNLWGTKVGEE